MRSNELSNGFRVMSNCLMGTDVRILKADHRDNGESVNVLAVELISYKRDSDDTSYVFYHHKIFHNTLTIIHSSNPSLWKTGAAGFP